MPTGPANATLARIFDPVGRCLTPESAQRLLALRADPDVQDRVDVLADKSTAGTLTDEERGEYEAYVAAATLIAVLQAKARALLTTQPAA